MDDNRLHKRYLLVNNGVTCKMLLATEVRLLDISQSGASIMTNKRLNIGGRYTLKVHTGSATLRLQSEAVWEQLCNSKKTANGDVVPLYKAGLRFDTVLTGDGAEVLELLASTLPASQMRPRLGGLRVHVNGRSAFIDFTENYQVKEISIDGMVVETDSSLDPGAEVILELLLHEEEPLSFACRVTSCVPSMKQPGFYSIGFEFLNMGPEAHAHLSDFISTLDGSRSK